MKRLLRPLAWLSLGANHGIGAFLGRLVYLLSPRYRRRLLDNLGQSGLAGSAGAVRRMARENASEIGKGATELIWALFRPSEEVAAKVIRRVGWEGVERLRAGGKPILFVIPHLGGYDVAGRYIWTQVPIMAMYRPNKLAWLDEMMREGRNRGAAPDGSNVAPASMAGVRMLLRFLRKGGCSIVLPDQVPGVGDGEWVDFFGRPAYTMTLVGRLQEASGAALVFCFAERLPGGEGFVLHCEPLDQPLPVDRRESARRVNEGVEKLIRMCPSQYLWGYNRYKRPAGAPPPP